MLQSFTAIERLGASGLEASIISILAEDEETARKRIWEELSKPGRLPFRDRWERSGKIVKQK